LGSLKKECPFVVEGDEYDTAFFDKGPKFLHYRPHYLLATSLEYDHADIYKNVEEIETRFTELFSLVPQDGVIVACNQYPHLLKSLQKAHPKAKVLTYGHGGDFEVQDVKFGEFGIRFDVMKHQKCLGNITVPLTGKHNVDNALGCYATLHAMGLSHDDIAAGFSAFKGVKRRMEERGQVNDVIVIDDFAHHPTAVSSTIEGAQLRYPNHHIWAIFEPRSATSCRKVFQDDYAKSFSKADRVFLAPSGRALDPDTMLDVNKLAQDISDKNIPAKYFTDIDSIVSTIRDEVKPHTILLCMSNGGFGGIHNKLLEALEGLKK